MLMGLFPIFWIADLRTEVPFLIDILFFFLDDSHELEEYEDVHDV